jgi:hypothetical protein
MINKDTQLCMSLSGRPGNFGTTFHNYLYQKLGLNFIYKAFTTTDIESAVKGIRALGIRGLISLLGLHLNLINEKVNISTNPVLIIRIFAFDIYFSCF